MRARHPAHSTQSGSVVGTSICTSGTPSSDIGPSPMPNRAANPGVQTGTTPLRRSGSASSSGSVTSPM
jgi:hypothetical protein